MNQITRHVIKFCEFRSKCLPSMSFAFEEELTCRGST